MRKSFDIAFYCRRSRMDKRRMVPIEMSVSLNGQRAMINLPMKADPDRFATLASSKRANEVKNYLAMVESKINNLQVMMSSSDRALTVDLIREYVRGGFRFNYTLLIAFASDKETFAMFYHKDYDECDLPSDGDYLTVSTIHSAKGLEWDTVYVMGLCEGNFPNPYFCKDNPESEQQEFFSNEWKKMYVAATRARKQLVLLYPSSINRKGYTFKKGPSRFIPNI